MINTWLNNKTTIPCIGFGTWQILLNGRAKKAVLEALNAGYRLIDTAFVYGNEKGVGQAIRESKVKRSDIFVTTKLWNFDQGYDKALKAFEKSLTTLGLEYVDLYLIHWPQSRELTHESWRAFETIYASKHTKSIGVSNYNVEQLKDLLSGVVTSPSVNQIEFHPFVYKKQKPIVDFCHDNNIVVEAYSPLARAKHWSNPVIVGMSEKYGKSEAQILLRWAIQHGTVPIPKSSNPERMKQNLNVFDFEISIKDMEKLNQLSNGEGVL